MQSGTHSIMLRKGTTADLALPLCGMCPGERLAGMGARGHKPVNVHLEAGGDRTVTRGR